MSTDKDTPGVEDCADVLREQILSDYPRLGPSDTFKFGCHPGVSCFNRCCADVNIFLSPYDVLRMKNRLGMESGDFLDKYVLMPVQKDMKTPVLVLRMNDDEAKTCPFVTEEGCGIYSDRPWPCRIYPVGQATPSEGSEEEGFYFLLEEDVCKGFAAEKEWTIQEWLEDQGVGDYDEIGKQYQEIAMDSRILQGKPLELKQVDMYFMASYDLDKFRRFLFETTFFEKFEVDKECIEALKEDDVALLEFAFRWLRFFLFGEDTLKVSGGTIQATKDKLS